VPSMGEISGRRPTSRGLPASRRQVVAMSARYEDGARRIDLVVAAALILAILFIISNRAPGEEPQAISDRTITREVESSLDLNQGLSAHLIDVSTDSGVVTLSGTVDNLVAGERAVNVAERVKGVLSVTNDLKVGGVARTDTEVRDDVRAALRRDVFLQGSDFPVAVDNGVVTLRGEAASWEQRRMAEEVAMGVAGARGLVNMIAVEQGVARSDDAIRQDVVRRLELDPFVYEGLIHVWVTQGKVVLSGVVGTAAERTRANLDSWVPGVNRVDVEGLDVRPWAGEELRRKSRGTFAGDAELMEAVEDALHFDARTSESDLAVAVRDRVVTLTGVTNSLASKSAAEEDAWNVGGVNRVDNLIKVRPSFNVETELIRRDVEIALLRDAILERYVFTPLIRNRKVYLYGNVDTFEDRDRAIDVVSRVPGVVDVSDNLNVGYLQRPKSDQQIKEDILLAFARSLFVGGDNIEVSVKNGIATLSGAVAGWRELRDAMDRAFGAGAIGVKNELVVEDVPEYNPVFHRPR
jgi:osmotically-inducible protein OsmY